MKKLKHSGPFTPLAPRAEDTRSEADIKAALWDEGVIIALAKQDLLIPAQEQFTAIAGPAQKRMAALEKALEALQKKKQQQAAPTV